MWVCVNTSAEKSGNESSGQDFGSTRTSLAVNYMAHVADSQRFLLQGPLFSKTSARADSQKRRSPVPFRIDGRARKRESRAAGSVPMLALSYPNEDLSTPQGTSVSLRRSNS